LEDPAIGTHNEICPAPWFTVATGFITPQCRDFCADPCYHSTLERCLKIQCPRWVVGNIMLISNHIICNMTQRFYVKFSSDGQGHWEAHWPASLVPQGVETAISHGGNPWPVASFMTSTTSPTATVPTAENVSLSTARRPSVFSRIQFHSLNQNHRRDLRAAFHAYPAADESTFPAVVVSLLSQCSIISLADLALRLLPLLPLFPMRPIPRPVIPLVSAVPSTRLP